MENFEKRLIALRYTLHGKSFFNAIKALEFAKTIHNGLRKDGKTPEFQHQVDIALFILTLKNVPDLENIITAAILHDIMEDYDIDKNVIISKFGQEVFELAWLVTKTYRGVKKSEEYYFSEIATDYRAAIIKGADRVNNISTMVGVFTQQKQKEYVQETRKYVITTLKAARRNTPECADALLNIEQFLKVMCKTIETIYNVPSN